MITSFQKKGSPSFLKGILSLVLLMMIPFTAFSFTLMHEDTEGKGMMVYELRMLDVTEETLWSWNLDAAALGLPLEAPDTFFVEMSDLNRFDISTDKIAAMTGNTVNYTEFRTDFHPSVVTVPGENANIKVFTEKVNKGSTDKTGFTFSVTPREFTYEKGAPTTVVLKGEGRLTIDLNTVVDMKVGDWTPVALAVTTEKTKNNSIFKQEEVACKYRYAIIYLGMYIVDSSKDLGEISVLPFSNTGIENDPFFNRDEPVRRGSFAEIHISNDPTPTGITVGGEVQYVFSELFYLDTNFDYSINTGIQDFGLAGGIMIDEGFAIIPSINYGATMTNSATNSGYVMIGIEDVTRPSNGLEYYAGINFAAFDFTKGATATGFFFPLDWRLGFKWQTDNAWYVAAQIDGAPDFSADIWDNLLPRGLTTTVGYSFYPPVLVKAGLRINRILSDYSFVPFIGAQMAF
jgi:hypothetical protein